MSRPYTIRRMQPDELHIAIEWAEQEGWNPGLDDAETFYRADPNGFFIGECGDEIVSVGSAVIYDDQFAFCGLYIVHPDHRGKGYGLELTKARLNYAGGRNVGIDGVIENIELYQRIGYRLAYRNTRYQGTARQLPFDQQTIQPLSRVRFELVDAYDHHCFPAHRSTFLKGWINQPHGEAVGFVEEGQLKGFAVRRQCVEGYKIGPLFADDGTIAEALFRALQKDVVGELFYLDIAEINPAARQLVEQQSMEAVFSTGRMYQQGQPELAYQKIFGITTFELG